jgi:hypothetical protein
MPLEFHQTTCLSRRSNRGLDGRASVTELAAMLGGEAIRAKPKCVSPVIAGFLRAYSESLPEAWLADLYEYASRIVGTRAPRPVERSRGRRCIDWCRVRGMPVPLRIRARPPGTAAVGAWAGRHAIRSSPAADHVSALAFVDELIAFGDSWAGLPADAAQLLAIGSERPGDFD